MKAFNRVANTGICLAAVLAGTAAVGVQADTSEEARIEMQIRAALEQARPELQVEDIRPSAAPGLYEVQLGDGGPLLYATAGGEFFVLGDLFAVNPGGLVNLSEQGRDAARRELLAGVGLEDMIIFSPRGATRGAITVFTDVDCFYCQELHREVPALNEAGVEVRYLAFPRSGIGGDSYRRMASAWCSADPQAAITTLKNRESIPDNVCPGNPVAEQWMLGQQAGVRGTPALVLEDGRMIAGYLNAHEIVGRLGLH